MPSAKRTVPPGTFDVFHAGSNVDDYLANLDVRGEETDRVRLVPLGALLAAVWQPRKYDDDAKIAELAASIRANGLLHPITVRPRRSNAAPAGPYYEVVAGHRRLAALSQLSASRDAGEPEILAPVMVKELDDVTARILTHTENADREGLSPWETARSICNVRNALREAGEPHDVRAVAQIVKRADGPTSEYLKIAERIPESVWLAAGVVRGGAVDFETVSRISKGQLYKAAQSPDAETCLRSLVEAAAKARGRMRPLVAPSEVARVTGTDMPRAHGAPSALRNSSRAPRFTHDGLKSRGGFTMKLTKPFSSYSPEEARSYLRDLLPALSALAEVAGRQYTLAAQSAGPGMVVYLSHNPMKVRTGEERDSLLREIDAIRAALLRDCGGTVLRVEA